MTYDAFVILDQKLIFFFNFLLIFLLLIAFTERYSLQLSNRLTALMSDVILHE